LSDKFRFAARRRKELSKFEVKGAMETVKVRQLKKFKELL
jgi:hypothetical protein